MFTGIVEEVGRVLAIEQGGTNHDLMISARMAPDLRVDQSVSHNGVCLTVVEVLTPIDRATAWYRVTAVEETLKRSNLGELRAGDPVNLERSLRVGDRLDGHMVQGHVDDTVTCTAAEERDGSWWFSFEMPKEEQLLVAKGSICLNGVSLTIADLRRDGFSVAIIPFTHAHTTFHALRAGMRVNVEYDVLGKYVARLLEVRTPR
jgi:riboflavin synthase